MGRRAQIGVLVCLGLACSSKPDEAPVLVSDESVSQPEPGDKRSNADPELAALEKACDAGDFPDCIEAARVYESRASPGPNPQAAALYRKACTLGDSYGCERADEHEERIRNPPKRKKKIEKADATGR